MDQNNQNRESDYTDLAQQYQEILEKYSQELAKAQPSPETAPTPSNLSEVSPVSSDVLMPAPPAPEIKEPEINPAPTESLAELSLPSPPEPPVNPFPEVGPALTESQPLSNFPKIFFFITLIIFLGVAAAVGYKLFNSGSFVLTSSNSSNQLPTSTPAATTAVSGTDKVCEVNDQKYAVDETFSATDGCNTCTCTSDLVITCTQNTCTGTPSPAAAVNLPKNWLTYSNAKFNYSLKYPNTLTLNQSTLNRVILAFNSSSNITVSVWTKAVAPTLTPDNSKNYSSTTVGGLPAKQGREYGSIYMMNTYVYSDQYVYQIRYSGEEIQKQLDIYQQVLSSFTVKTSVAATPSAAVASPSVSLQK